MFQLSSEGKQKVLSELKRYESKQSAVLPALYIGQKENNGVFAYSLVYTTFDGTQHSVKGNITLIR